jgi:hypothetical protein
MKTGKKAILAFCGAALAAACSTGGHQVTSGTAGNPPASQGAPGSSEDIGAVGMQLTLPGGEHISTLTYKLWDAANTYTGTYSVADAATLSFVIGSVATAGDYELTLSATTDDGKDTCSYPQAGVSPSTEAPIAVANRTTTVVNVNMQCVNNQGLDSGSVLINASQTECPVWNSLVANPINLALGNGGYNVNDSGTAGIDLANGTKTTASIQDGQSLVLVGSATSPQHQPMAFTWTTTGGTLSSAAGTTDPNSAGQPNGQTTTNQTIFTCPSSGQATYTVTMAVNGAFDAATCDPSFTTTTIQITCTSLVPCAATAIAGGGAAPGVSGGLCLTSEGSLSSPYIGSTSQDSQGNYCCQLACTGPNQTVASNWTTNGQGQSVPSTSGGCSTPGTQNNGAGCCVPLLACTNFVGGHAVDVNGSQSCVQCQGSNNGVCSPTQAIVVAHDVAKNNVVSAGPDTSANSCYACLVGAGCLDDNGGDSNHECEDSVITHGTAAQCHDVITCIFGSDSPATDSLASQSVDEGYSTGNCSSAATNICYCGTAPVLGSCGGSASAQNGVCAGVIAAGSGFPVADGTDILNTFAVTTYASGMAEQVFKCAVSSGCSTCLN